MSEPLLKMYAVRESTGWYYCRSKQRNDGDSLINARVWSRPGPARALVTLLAETEPEKGVPTLVELHVTRVVDVDETRRVAARKASQISRRAKRELRDAELELRRAQDNLASLLPKKGGKFDKGALNG